MAAPHLEDVLHEISREQKLHVRGGDIDLTPASMATPALLPSSLILVTGATGYIASHIISQLLEQGYYVRGTTRDTSKSQWLLDQFSSKHPDSFQLVSIPDMSAPSAFESALKDVSGIIHVASDLSFNPDPNVVIPPIVQALKNLLESANASPTVRRFVFTSSSSAAVDFGLGSRKVVDGTSWNDGCVRRAWAPAPYSMERFADVCSASKVESELALWKFSLHTQPHFTINSVLPGTNFGPVLVPTSQGASSANFIFSTLKGGTVADNVAPQFFVDVRDNARLHVAALLDAELTKERVFACAGWWTKGHLIRILRKDGLIKSEHSHTGEEVSNVDISGPRIRAEALLQKWYGKDFTSLEESAKDTVVKH